MSKSTNYSEKVLDHFKNPRNVGTLEGDNVAVGRVGNPVCGDLMDIYIKVGEGDKIEDIKFKTFGCGSAVATSSMITEIAKGKTLDDAMRITRQDVANELEGLPPIKMHCSNLAADALHEAIKNFKEGKQGPVEPAEARFACPAGEAKGVPGLAEYAGKGVYSGYEGTERFKDKRVLVVEFDHKSVEFALELTKVTGRVILLSPLKELATNDELKAKVKRSDVKHLKQAELVAVSGGSEVEKVRINDLDENEEYDLFVDAVVVPA
ncbi:MAG: iron-sulfur cluster assembly scaffold protein [Candidatus Lokiarchaeota archaeon]|nr:iron-sulfur cluster assembly scaffold protein [Candidatus Lokiarchaeota archaeon]